MESVQANVCPGMDCCSMKKRAAADYADVISGGCFECARFAEIQVGREMSVVCILFAVTRNFESPPPS